ncbi:uncharacterized protein CLUP02_05080 [Colletotrichum lupini]|uniref:Uncharacterized protein n=1 Tax=Colletotrichum lupini TaxID=145971 RepID=A0A9Q8SMF9_9PEZI|nr:uncharacterized protein CLUP02_05080 [Colletotrichum lupini]UQC79600.1 hypothetical protein CLUP02_05080 [Colletotrichum lupini]
MFCSFESPVCTWIILFQKYSKDAKRQWIETLDRPSHMVLSPLSVSHIRTEYRHTNSLQCPQLFYSCKSSSSRFGHKCLGEIHPKSRPSTGSSPAFLSPTHSLHAARLFLHRPSFSPSCSTYTTIGPQCWL